MRAFRKTPEETVATYYIKRPPLEESIGDNITSERADQQPRIGLLKETPVLFTDTARGAGLPPGKEDVGEEEEEEEDAGE